MMNVQGYQAASSATATVRQISDAERQSFNAVLRPMKMNAIGIALVAMLMAVMVNFVPDQWMIILPLVFGFIALGLAIQVRTTAGKIANVLARGNVVDVRAAFVQKGAGGSWNFGAFSVHRDSALNSLLVEGTPATVTIVPESKHLLSVNYSLLKKPIQFNAIPGFESLLGMSPAVQAYPQPAPVQMAQSPPPPPPPPSAETWSPSFCAQCGSSLPGGALFCSKCGAKVKR